MKRKKPATPRSALPRTIMMAAATALVAGALVFAPQAAYAQDFNFDDESVEFSFEKDSGVSFGSPSDLPEFDTSDFGDLEMTDDVLADPLTEGPDPEIPEPEVPDPEVPAPNIEAPETEAPAPVLEPLPPVASVPAETPAPEAPTPEDPDTEDPDTEDPDTEDPDTEDPDTEDPDTEDPDTEDPDTEDPDTEDPDTEDPDTEDPDTEDPDTEDPDTEDPDTEDPDTEDPDTEDPDTEDPDTEDPDTEDPDTEDPDTEDPDTEDPDTEDPDTEVPAPDTETTVAAPAMEKTLDIKEALTDGSEVTAAEKFTDAKTENLKVDDSGVNIGPLTEVPADTETSASREATDPEATTIADAETTVPSSAAKETPDTKESSIEGPEAAADGAAEKSVGKDAGNLKLNDSGSPDPVAGPLADATASKEETPGVDAETEASKTVCDVPGVPGCQGVQEEEVAQAQVPEKSAGDSVTPEDAITNDGRQPPPGSEGKYLNCPVATGCSVRPVGAPFSDSNPNVQPEYPSEVETEIKKEQLEEVEGYINPNVPSSIGAQDPSYSPESGYVPKPYSFTEITNLDAQDAWERAPQNCLLGAGAAAGLPTLQRIPKVPAKAPNPWINVLAAGIGCVGSAAGDIVPKLEVPSQGGTGENWLIKYDPDNAKTWLLCKLEETGQIEASSCEPYVKPGMRLRNTEDGSEEVYQEAPKPGGSEE